MNTLRHPPRVVVRGSLPPLQSLPLPDRIPGFQLDYSYQARPYTVYVRARNSMAADAEGRIQLAAQFHDFDPTDARLVACRETY